MNAQSLCMAAPALEVFRAHRRIVDRRIVDRSISGLQVGRDRADYLLGTAAEADAAMAEIVAATRELLEQVKFRDGKSWFTSDYRHASARVDKCLDRCRDAVARVDGGRP